jgi:hypothetical protein
MKRMALVLFMSCLAFKSRVEAQECPERSDALILAILTVHEAGWAAFDDMRGIDSAIRNMARRDGTGYAEAACTHSGRSLRGETRRVWVSRLNEAGDIPEGLAPEMGSWVRRLRGLWMRTLEEARNVVAGPLACPGVMTWGSLDDITRREIRGYRVWVNVRCGETRNRMGRWERRGR